MDAMTPRSNPKPAGSRHPAREGLRLRREILATLDHRLADAALRPPVLTSKCVTFNVGAIRRNGAA
jgi:hypothetical protein